MPGLSLPVAPFWHTCAYAHICTCAHCVHIQTRVRYQSFNAYFVSQRTDIYTLQAKITIVDRSWLRIFVRRFNL